MAALPDLAEAASSPSPRMRSVGRTDDRSGTDEIPGAATFELAAFRLHGGAVRAVVSGSAGSGKTTLLHRVAGLLSAEGAETAMLRGSTDVAALSAATVLIADDAHLLDEDRVTALIHRAEDPDAGLVVAVRSWPVRPDVAALCRLLERSRPAILLGGVSTASGPDGAGFGACDDDVLRLTGGIPWLMHECRAAHDADACRDDPAHHAMQRAIRPRVLHRLMSAPPRVRRLVDELSLGVAPTVDDAMSAGNASAVIAEGYAEGLLGGDGRPAPAVAAAVRDMTSTARLIELVRIAAPATLRDDAVVERLGVAHDTGAAEALTARARAEVARDPRLAGELFDRAVDCGADPTALAVDRARAAWGTGDLDTAGALLDGVLAALRGADAPPAVDLAAAIWAERGLARIAADVYRTCSANDGGGAHGRVAAIAAGRMPAPAAGTGVTSAGDEPPPSALRVAHALLDTGLSAALGGHADAAVAALRRASELYTASGDDSPSVELPAVIGAIACIGVGDVRSAQAVIDDALQGGQGGPRARARLELWGSWVALQRERPVEARAALARATSAGALAPRDDSLAAAISIGLARRYDDAAGLAVEWHACLPRISRTEPDLFSLLPLGELVIAAARLGEATALQSVFEKALAVTAGIGDPAIWSAPLHWAGIQRGILLNRPDALGPHARALVAAAPHNRLAACMAHAGKVWTAVLSGAVDADSVEQAARGLAAVGMAWDGARLAGHGASRSEDRKAIARLLACARELHPRETPRGAEERQDSATKEAAGDGSLSEREREVAELVLQGKTYAEIGAAIFISPRTAEHHIAHIRRRLDATSRSDLLSKLRIALDGAAVEPASGGSHP
ncbi:LuxR C-terminal-related transcriptional regulator [Microbacterium timonense]|uniref:LuxR C-terminal-related transcriptional regulator n=1 Tax=Microbacterium timonense TaxID=2086576 RepID=UPI000D0FB762|nr:LuxR C-terminal-related transcriptional regulator [Microbacterium timonense]